MKLDLDLEPLKIPPDKLIQGVFQAIVIALAKIDVLDIRLSRLAQGETAYSDEDCHEMEKKIFQESYTYFVEKLGE